MITSIALTAFAVSATVWMPEVVTDNEAQFGFFGVALSLVTWFSGAAICVLVGACAGPVLRGGHRARSARSSAAARRATLTAGAAPPLPPPTRELSLRDAFQRADES